MHQVLFYSKGGNTRKLANVIAKELDVKAADIKAASVHPAFDIIFFGSGCKGKAFLLFNQGHPNQEDLAGAIKLAKEMANLG